MVEYEKLKYEVEVDTSSLGPQLALAQTQIGAALSDQVGVGMAAQLPRPAGGIGLGDVVYGLGTEGNLAYQKAALFSQTAISHTAGVQAMPAPIIIQSPVQQQFIPQQEPYSQMPGMNAMGFQPNVQVGPMALLLGRSFTEAAPWATKAEESLAVSRAWGDVGWGMAGFGADMAAWGGGATAGAWIGKALGVSKFMGGVLGLGAGILAGSVVAGGFEAMGGVRNWGRMAANYNVPITDAMNMARDMQGYGPSQTAVFGRGILEGVDFTGLLQMERASRVASKYGLQSRAARENPEFMLQAGIRGFSTGIIDSIYGDVKSQTIDMARATDMIMTNMDVDTQTASQIARQMVDRGASLQALSAIRNIDLYDPILDAYTDPASGGRPGAAAQLAIELTRYGGAPIARSEGFTPESFAGGVIASRMTVSDLFSRGTFGDPQRLRGFGITPNTIMGDLSTMGQAAAQSPLNMAVSTALLGGYEGPMDADSVYKRMAGIVEKGNIMDHVTKGANAVTKGGAKSILQLQNRQAKLRNLMTADPKVAAIMVKAQMDFLQSATNGTMDNETIELYMINNAMRMGLDPSAMESALSTIRQIGGNWMAAEDAASIGSVSPIAAIREGDYLGSSVVSEFSRAALTGTDISPQEMKNVAYVMYANREEFGLDEWEAAGLAGLAEEAAAGNVSMSNARTMQSHGYAGVVGAKLLLEKAGLEQGGLPNTMSFASKTASSKFRAHLAKYRKQHGAIAKFLTEQGSFGASDIKSWFGDGDLPIEQLKHVSKIMTEESNKEKWATLMTELETGEYSSQKYSFDLSSKSTSSGAALADVLGTLQIAAARFTEEVDKAESRLREQYAEASNHE